MLKICKKHKSIEKISNFSHGHHLSKLIHACACTMSYSQSRLLTEGESSAKFKDEAKDSHKLASADS